jgi:hypothetical protein
LIASASFLTFWGEIRTYLVTALTSITETPF